MKTVLQLRTEIINQCWPSGAPENLATRMDPTVASPYEQIFQEGMAEIAKWVPCEQTNNVNVIPFCATYYKCAQTVITAPSPNAMIKRLYTLIDQEWCDPVYYRMVPFPEPEWFGRRLMSLLGDNLVGPPSSNMPLGFAQANPVTDSEAGRARTGIFALHKGNIYIAPWIQSNEVVVIEWDGIKLAWSDLDFITETQDYKKALKLYFQYGHERDYGSQEKALLMHNPQKSGTFDEALGDLMWQCRENTKVREMPLPPDTRGVLTYDMIQKGLPPEVPLTGAFAHIGNYGDNGTAAQAVAALLETWGLAGIVTSGNNAVGVDYDTGVGSPYHEWLAPYTGAFGTGSDTNRFWPAIGEEDDPVLMAEFFTLLPNNGRYYELFNGSMHFFVINSMASEVDGIAAVSFQAQWLKSRMAISTAPWKIVVMYDSPYASTNANETLRWPFKLWGANLVLGGRNANYERMVIDGLGFINNGLGGVAPIAAYGAADENTYSQYAADYGAGRLTGSPDQLLWEFLNSAGETIDAWVIEA